MIYNNNNKKIKIYMCRTIYLIIIIIIINITTIIIIIIIITIIINFYRILSMQQEIIKLMNWKSFWIDFLTYLINKIKWIFFYIVIISIFIPFNKLCHLIFFFWVEHCFLNKILFKIFIWFVKFLFILIFYMKLHQNVCFSFIVLFF